jgi:hypothetical protein
MNKNCGLKNKALFFIKIFPFLVALTTATFMIYVAIQHNPQSSIVSIDGEYDIGYLTKIFVGWFIITFLIFYIGITLIKIIWKGGYFFIKKYF